MVTVWCRWSSGLWEPGVQRVWVCARPHRHCTIPQHGQGDHRPDHLLCHHLHANDRRSGLRKLWSFSFSSLLCFVFFVLFCLPWYNHAGWLGIKHQVTSFMSLTGRQLHPDVRCWLTQYIWLVDWLQLWGCGDCWGKLGLWYIVTALMRMSW